MKKNLLLIASVLFLWKIGLAQTPTTGTITVLVPKHLQIDIRETSIQFTYNEADGVNGLPPTNVTDYSIVRIDANVNWKLSVSSLGGESVLTNPNTTMTIPASLFEYYLTEIQGIVTPANYIIHKFFPASAPPVTGSKNANFKMYWRPNPSFSGNVFAGDYTIGISYSLTEQ